MLASSLMEKECGAKKVPIGMNHIRPGNLDMSLHAEMDALKKMKKWKKKPMTKIIMVRGCEWWAGQLSVTGVTREFQAVSFRHVLANSG